jgi:hypothetical protein
MRQEELISSIQGVLAHLWMIRTFLKHADEIQDDENMLEVPRTLFDYIRATEPAYQVSSIVSGKQTLIIRKTLGHFQIILISKWLPIHLLLVWLVCRNY